MSKMKFLIDKDVFDKLVKYPEHFTVYVYYKNLIEWNKNNKNKNYYDFDEENFFAIDVYENFLLYNKNWEYEKEDYENSLSFLKENDLIIKIGKRIFLKQSELKNYEKPNLKKDLKNFNLEEQRLEKYLDNLINVAE